VAGALLTDLQPVDFLEAPRTVREEALARLRLGGIGKRAFLLPRPAVRLCRHGPRAELDLVDRLVVGAPPLLVPLPRTIDVAVRRPIQFGCVGFERMCAELLYIDSDRGCQPLRAQHVEPRWRAVRVR